MTPSPEDANASAPVSHVDVAIDWDKKKNRSFITIRARQGLWIVINNDQILPGQAKLKAGRFRNLEKGGSKGKPEPQSTAIKKLRRTGKGDADWTRRTRKGEGNALSRGMRTTLRKQKKMAKGFHSCQHTVDWKSRELKKRTRGGHVQVKMRGDDTAFRARPK